MRMSSLQKRDVKLRVLILSCLALLTATALPVFADATSSIVGAVESMLRDILMVDSATAVRNILTAEPTTTYGDVWNVVQYIVDNVITPASYSVLGLFFVTSFVRLGLKYEGFNMEAFAKPFVSYVAAFLLVQYTPFILTSGLRISAWFVGQITSAGAAAATSNDGVLTEAVTQVKAGSTSMWAALVYWGQLLLPWLASKALGLYMQLIAYSVVIEMFVRACLMPLSFGDLCARGLDGYGFRYVKAFIAACLRGGLMVLVAMIVGFFMNSAFVNIHSAGDWMGMIGKMIVLNATGALMMTRTNDVAREVVGV